MYLQNLPTERPSDQDLFCEIRILELKFQVCKAKVHLDMDIEYLKK